MPEDNHQFYKNLSILYVLTTVAATFFLGGTGNSFAQGLNIVLAFFVCGQFFLERWKYKEFLLVMFLAKGFFMEDALEKFRLISGDHGSSPFFSGSYSQYYGFFWGLFLLVPTFYLLINLSKWLPKISPEKTTKHISEKAELALWIPFVTVALIVLSSWYFGTGFSSIYGIQTFLSVVPSEIIDLENISGSFEFRGTPLLIVPMILVIMFAFKDRIEFGFSILLFFVIQIGFFILQNIYSLVFNEIGSMSNQYLGVEWLLKCVVPIAGFAYYFSVFRTNEKIRQFIKFDPIPEPGGEQVPDERPETKFETFSGNNQHFLKNDSVPVFASSGLFGLTLFLDSLGKDLNKHLLIASLGLILLFMAVLFFVGVRKKMTGMINTGFTGIIIFLVILFALGIVGEHKLLYGAVGIVLILFCLINTFVWGTPIVMAFNNDLFFVKYVQNRNGTRIFNQLLTIRFWKLDLKEGVADKFARQLIPWQERKTSVFWLLGIQGLSMAISMGIYPMLFFSFNDSGLSLFTSELCFFIVFISLQLAMLKWILMLNVNFCLTMVVFYGVILLLMGYQFIQSSLVQISAIIGLLVIFAQFIIYAVMLDRGIKRSKMIGSAELNEREDILD